MSIFDALRQFITTKEIQLNKLSEEEILEGINHALEDINFCLEKIQMGVTELDNEQLIERMDNDVKESEFLTLQLTRRQAEHN